ncbi:hypothetical protein JOC37_000838 [Desulfohalotomaculum tongense]|uniref:hypothetical protein n=1 Tax=Desulforadius tongensis TaxID=1216062 RepID=UPI00195E0DB1|nr:hypothetical protein [Desulforadius tongensis]MBM7854465.1 hypothetical protein [Desulforadius tongensis]
MNFTIREMVDLEEHLHLEGNNIVNFNHYARECRDQQLKSFCTEMTRRRMHAFQLLANHIARNSYQ